MSHPAVSLFTLAPVNAEAVWVIMQPENRRYWGNRDTTRPDLQFLAFSANQSSKIAGRLVSIGRHENNDIRLPTRGPDSSSKLETKRGRSYQNYRNEHCFFFLTATGELVLRDNSPRLTFIEVEDATPEESVLYALHGQNPRQRVIPRMDRVVYVTIGSSTTFRLKWGSALRSDPRAQRFLAERARHLAVPGMTPTAPGSASYEPPGLHSRELRSRYTPSAASQSGPRKACHKYAALGSGGFGAVFKAVDLSSGELWAVKEIVAPSPGQARLRGSIDALKASLVQEVENMAKLSHPHIVHYETFQDFRIDGTFQIFYKLYEGSLLDRIARDCSQGPRHPAPWMPRLVLQMASALEYLHGKGVLHLDIKPHNILFDHAQGDPLPNFYLGDFGLATAEAEFQGTCIIGTPFYQAPEIRLGLGAPCRASDIWSLAMTIGQALGFWSPQSWAEAFQVPGSEVPGAEGLDYQTRLWYSFYRHIAKMVAMGQLPPIFSRMLLEQERRPAATDLVRDAKTQPACFITAPGNPQPLRGWPGKDLPWFQAVEAAPSSSRAVQSINGVGAQTNVRPSPVPGSFQQDQQQQQQQRGKQAAGPPQRQNAVQPPGRRMPNQPQVRGGGPNQGMGQNGPPQQRQLEQRQQLQRQQQLQQQQQQRLQQQERVGSIVQPRGRNVNVQSQGRDAPGQRPDSNQIPRISTGSDSFNRLRNTTQRVVNAASLPRAPSFGYSPMEIDGAQ